MLINQAPPASKGRSVIFFGGDVNLGRRMNWNPHKKPFGDLKIMAEADLRIINLACVAAAQGTQGINKGEAGPYYYHARPEQINLLAEANIDVALTANNHSLDYYAPALLEQNNYLDRAGILHCGTGKNSVEAARPLFIKVNEITVALFNVDTTTERYAATKDKPGNFYLPPDGKGIWEKFFKDKIADARKKADVVLVVPHWIPGGTTEPLETIRLIGELLIDCGADAVLGCHYNFKYGVETYKNRPIIYNASNFLFDLNFLLGGGFSIIISKRGVEQIFFAPLAIEPCKISPANAAQTEKITTKFLNSCRALKTEATLVRGDLNLIELKFNPPPRAEKILEPVTLSSSRRNGEIILPMTEPLPQWTADEVPDDAKIEPQKFGAIKLIGCRVPPECMIMKLRQMLYVETWWTIDAPTDKDLTFQILGVPTVKDTMPNFGAGMEHQACDWLFPTNRWKAGVIYYERYGLRPPVKRDMVNVDLSLQISVLDGKNSLGNFVYPKKIQMQIPDCPTLKPKVQTKSQAPAPPIVTKPIQAKPFKPPVLTPNIFDSPSGDAEVDNFRREFKKNNGVVLFMLRNIKATTSGLEISAFRRAKLFRKYLGVEVNIMTNQFQNDVAEQCEYHGIDVRVFNMYDYFQEINRAVEKPRKVFIEPMHEGYKIERLERDLRICRVNGSIAMYCAFSLKDQKLSFINFFDENHNKIHRDYYDALGFRSCRQELEPETGKPHEIFYYRPDGTLAVHELCEYVDNDKKIKLLELIDRNGKVTNTFKNLDDALAYWMLKLLNDKDKNYFLIADRRTEWDRTYAEIKSAGLENVRVLHQLHNTHVIGTLDPFSSPTKNLYKYFLTNKNSKAEAIISLTQRQRSDIIKRYELDNIIVLPHSLAEIPKITDVEREPFKIVQVGRIVEEKGHAKSVEVMKRVLKKVPQATLHFYGKGTNQSKVQELINENKLNDHIKFEGVSQNIPAVFASAALSILPSTLEGFPLVIQESLSQDCPVVAFDCNYGPADGIEDGVNGFLVPVNDIDAMAERIIEILTVPGLREKMAANCAKSVEKFSPQNVSRQWADIFSKLLNTKGV